MTILVRNVMTPSPTALSPQHGVADAAAAMRSVDVGALPIVDSDGRLRGIVTDRDLVLRALAGTGIAGEPTLQEVLTHDPLSIHPDATLEDARELMAVRRIRRLPVVDRGVIGMVSLGDIAWADLPRQAVADTLREVSESPSTRSAT